MKTVRTAAALALVLSAVQLCGCIGASKPELAAAAPVQRQPGSWQLVHYTVAFDGTGIEGFMAELVAAGKASIGKKDFGGPVCLSAAQAGKDDLAVRLHEAILFGPEWKVVRSAIAADGEDDFTATMDDPAQGHSEMTITGTITRAATDLVLTTDAYQPAPGKGHIHTVMKQENTRVGDGTPGEDAMSEWTRTS